VVFRDVKPGNVMLARGRLYLVDFGLCKGYLQGGRHVPCREGRGLTGTPVFASGNAHLGLELSRRDDIVSAVYTALSLIQPLPWQAP
jgi:serine/threonine protein kinase